MVKVDQTLKEHILNNLAGILENRKNTTQFQIDLLESYNEEEEVLKEKHYLRTSQLVGCMRKEYYRNLGYEQVMEPESFITLSAGTFYHHLIQTVLAKELVSKEGLLTYQLDGVKISGHYDGVLALNGEKRILEIKTTSPFAFSKLMKEIADVEENYKKLSPNMTLFRYLLQANMYIKMLGDKDVNGGWILIINKASVKGIPPLFSLKFDYDKRLPEIMIKKAQIIWKHFKEKKLPPPTKEKWECRYCGYVNCPLNARYKNEK